MKSAPLIVHVALADRSYDIQIGSGNLADVAKRLGREVDVTQAFVVTDENVDALYADPLADQLAAHDIDVNVLVVDAGEESKSSDVLVELWESMLAERADRHAVVVAVGGGVVGALAGFAAASYARGISFFQVPTTLLAQVDSSVGGKTGINLPTAKNMVGAFWQPIGVVIDVDVLSTLPEREYRAGLAEVVKYGVILDLEFFQFLEQQTAAIQNRQADVLVRIIERCCQLKAEVVVADEREQTGLRSVLNYGHTFCHALEAATGYQRLLHGEAVAIGMDWAMRLAARVSRVDESLVLRQRELLQTIGLATSWEGADADELLELMRHDKKARHGQLRFVLPSKIGHVELVDDVDEADVRAVLADS